MSRLDRLMKLREMDPGDADVAYMIAQEHAKAGDHQEALVWYDRCLETDPKYHYAYFHKARSQESADDLDGARVSLDRGLAAATSDGNAKAIGEIRAYLDEISA